jgi:hypothetical protein
LLHNLRNKNNYFLRPREKLTNQTTKVVQKRGIIPVIVISGKARSISQIINILIIKPKNPKVNILKGRKAIFIIGLIKKLIKPRKTPAIIKYLISPLKSTPGTNLTASQKPAMPPRK